MQEVQSRSRLRQFSGTRHPTSRRVILGTADLFDMPRCFVVETKIGCILIAANNCGLFIDHSQYEPRLQQTYFGLQFCLRICRDANPPSRILSSFTVKLEFQPSPIFVHMVIKTQFENPPVRCFAGSCTLQGTIRRGA